MSASEPVVAVRLEIVVELGELPGLVRHRLERGRRRVAPLARASRDAAALLDLVADVTGPSEVRL